MYFAVVPGCADEYLEEDGPGVDLVFERRDVSEVRCFEESDLALADER